MPGGGQTMSQDAVAKQAMNDINGVGSQSIVDATPPKKLSPTEYDGAISNIEKGLVYLGGEDANPSNRMYVKSVKDFQGKMIQYFEMQANNNNPEAKRILSEFSDILKVDSIDGVYSRRWSDLTKRFQASVALSDDAKSVSASTDDASAIPQDGVVGPRTARALMLALKQPTALTAEEFKNLTKGKWKVSDGVEASDAEQDKKDSDKREQERIKQYAGVDSSSDKKDANGKDKPGVKADGSKADKPVVTSGIPINGQRVAFVGSLANTNMWTAAARNAKTTAELLKQLKPGFMGRVAPEAVKLSTFGGRLQAAGSAMKAEVGIVNSTAGQAPAVAAKIPGLSKVFSITSKATGVLAIIGGIIDGFNVFSEVKANGGTQAQAVGEGVGSGLGTAAGGIAGLYAGAATGAAIGTLIPVPVVGTVVGALVGVGVAFACSHFGGKLGRWLGGAISGAPTNWLGQQIRGFFGR